MGLTELQYYSTPALLQGIKGNYFENFKGTFLVLDSLLADHFILNSNFEMYYFTTFSSESWCNGLQKYVSFTHLKMCVCVFPDIHFKGQFTP